MMDLAFDLWMRARWTEFQITLRQPSFLNSDMNRDWCSTLTLNELVSSQSVQCTHDSTEVGHNVELLNLKNQQIRMVEQVQFYFDYENRFQQRVYY